MERKPAMTEVEKGQILRTLNDARQEIAKIAANLVTSRKATQTVLATREMLMVMEGRLSEYNSIDYRIMDEYQKLIADVAALSSFIRAENSVISAAIDLHTIISLAPPTQHQLDTFRNAISLYLRERK